MENKTGVPLRENPQGTSLPKTAALTTRYPPRPVVIGPTGKTGKSLFHYKSNIHIVCVALFSCPRLNIK